MLVLTADQDWAPPWATLELCQRWAEAGLPGTLFVTHPCPSLTILRAEAQVELGWHPNFASGSSQGASEPEVLDFLERIVPRAAGARAHGLLVSTALMIEYGRRGLIYEGSYLLAGAPGLTPTVAWNGVVRLPIFWEDDVQMLAGRPLRLDAIELDRPGLKVFSFHPAHVALNSHDLGAYQRLKAHLAERGRSLWEATPADFDRCADRGPRGAADLLDELLGWLAARPDRSAGTMRQVAERARAEARWSAR